MKITGIRFHKGGRIYHFDPRDLDLKIGDMVVVDTSFGNESGEVVYVKETDKRIASRDLMPVLKKFDKKDYEQIKEQSSRREEYIDAAKELVEESGLEMKILDVSFSLDDKKVTFIFSSESRVDFRDLVKKISKRFKKQVVLRQIGPRDEARLLGGFGRCGRQFCCQNFLQDLESITMDMAKVQNMAGKGSSKISGVCGKLMCCLAYEVEVYKDLIINMPEIGSKIKTKHGQGIVVDQNIIKQTILVELEKNQTKVEVEIGEKEE